MVDWQNGLPDASIDDRGEKLRCGDFKLQFMKLDEYKSPKDGKEWLHTTFKILESNTPLLPIGSEAVHSELMSGDHPGMAMGRVKGMLCALLGAELPQQVQQVAQHLPGLIKDWSQLVNKTVSATARANISKANRPYRKTIFSSWIIPTQGWQPTPTPETPAFEDIPDQQVAPQVAPQAAYPPPVGAYPQQPPQYLPQAPLPPGPPQAPHNPLAGPGIPAAYQQPTPVQSVMPMQPPPPVQSVMPMQPVVASPAIPGAQPPSPGVPDLNALFKPQP